VAAVSISDGISQLKPTNGDGCWTENVLQQISGVPANRVLQSYPWLGMWASDHVSRRVSLSGCFSRAVDPCRPCCCCCCRFQDHFIRDIACKRYHGLCFEK
jgi:hypothetical protein